jgi:hypothetical protein
METLPRWLRIGYTLLVCVLVPVYLVEYRVATFLWFSNLALLLTLAAIWLRSRLLVGMMALAVVLPEIGWNVLFWGKLLLGWEGFNLGLLDYMFDPALPIWARLLSLYHVPLPFLLLWLVWKYGYDKRAFAWQTVLAWIVLPLSFAFGAPWHNINLVYGPLDAQGDPILSPPVPLLLIMAMLPLLIYWPTHALLSRLARAAIAPSTNR